MKSGRKPQNITDRELDLLKILWEAPEGLLVREIVERHPDPRPHVNTVATLIKILEEKGHVNHTAEGNAFRYHAITRKEDLRNKSLKAVIGNFFGNSYKSAVSALVADEKITVDELKEIIEMVEKGNKDNG